MKQTQNFSNSQKYERKLILQEKQAYEGAKMFYYGFLPFSICLIIIYWLYLCQLAEKQMSQRNMFIGFYLLLSIATYAIAVKFYRICNQTQTYPANRKGKKEGSINESIIQMSQQITQQHSQTNRFQNNNSQQDATQLKNLQSKSNKPSRYYCSFCQKQYEYRTKHCRKCRTCIQRYDHHCFWIGNCVGRHNHRQFYLFLFVQSLNNFFQMKTIIQLKACTYSLQMDIHILIWIIIYGFLLLSFGFLCFTGYLLIYHSMLITLSLTTWQHMKRQKISYLKYLPRGYNPFSIGWKNNIKKFFTQQTRYNNSKNIYLQEWQSYLPSFQQVSSIKPQFNFIDNQYYSCC